MNGYLTQLSARQLFWGVVFVTTAISLIARWAYREQGIANAGVAFSIPIPIPLTYLVVVAVLAGIICHLTFGPKPTQLEATALGLIVGGGGANLIDRIFHQGRVWDYIQFGSIGYFNLADLLVGCGLAIFLYNWWRYDRA